MKSLFKGISQFTKKKKNNMENKIYHVVGTVAKSNRKIVESEAKSISLTYIYSNAHFPGFVEIV